MAKDGGLLVIDGSDGVWSYVLETEVSIWPPAMRCAASRVWRLTVTTQRDGSAFVHDGCAVLLPDGTWDWDRIAPLPKMTRAEAMRLAHAHAPGYMVNDKTARQVMEEHKARHGEQVSCDRC
jgi:hypothetical protein